MIKFTNLNQEIPYLNFKKKYDDALAETEENIEAISMFENQDDLPDSMQDS